MEHNSFYSKSLHEKSPMYPLGIAQMITGIILFSFSLPWLIKIELFINGLINDESDIVISLAPNIVIAIFLFFISISFFLKGLKYLKKITITPNDPPEFIDYGKVLQSIVKGKLDIYKQPSSGPLKFAYDYISDKVPFLKPPQQKVVKMNVSFLKKYIFLLFIVVLVYYSQRFISDDILLELDIQQNFISIPYLFLIILLIFLVLTISTIFLLIPGNIPKQEVKEEIASIKGGGDPNQFCPLIEKAFYQYRFNKLPNRKYKLGFEKIEELSFNETGSFEGRFMMETHPKYLGSSKTGIASVIYIAIALSSLIVSLIYFSNINIIIGHPTNLLKGMFNLLAGFIFFRTSMRFYQRTSLLLNCFSYESFLISVEIEGTIGKTEITAGKAITDSLETKNIVIRSDSQLKVYATKIQSENRNISANRYITAMIIDDSVDDVLNTVINEINNFRDEGVAVRGIDISSESISKITNANLKIQGAKRSSMHEKALQETHIKPIEEKYEEAQPGTDNNSIESKECPQCAETIKAKARICRYCRYEFS